MDKLEAAARAAYAICAAGFCGELAVGLVLIVTLTVIAGYRDLRPRRAATRNALEAYGLAAYRPYDGRAGKPVRR